MQECTGRFVIIISHSRSSHGILDSAYECLCLCMQSSSEAEPDSKKCVSCPKLWDGDLSGESLYQIAFALPEPMIPHAHPLRNLGPGRFFGLMRMNDCNQSPRDHFLRSSSSCAYVPSQQTTVLLESHLRWCRATTHLNALPSWSSVDTSIPSISSR
jgi:hypothetical protein